MEFLFILILFFAMASGWLIGRQVFSVMEKRQNKWANSVSILVSMISLVVIFIAALVALAYSGAFHR